VPASVKVVTGDALEGLPPLPNDVWVRVRGIVGAGPGGSYRAIASSIVPASEPANPYLPPPSYE
jgi:hypothetical protein